MPNLEPLEFYISCSLSSKVRTLHVSYYVDENGSWDSDKFAYLLPNDIVMRLMSVLPPNIFLGTDRVAWRHTNDGIFMVTSAYEAYSQINNDSDSSILWRDIWRWKGLAKVQMCMWLIGHDRLPINDILASRKVINSSMCPFDCNVPEKMLHYLRGYNRALEVWSDMADSVIWPDFFNVNLQDWVTSNAKGNLAKKIWNGFCRRMCFFMSAGVSGLLVVVLSLKMFTLCLNKFCSRR